MALTKPTKLPASKAETQMDSVQAFAGHIAKPFCQGSFKVFLSKSGSLAHVDVWHSSGWELVTENASVMRREGRTVKDEPDTQSKNKGGNKNRHCR